MTPRVRRFSERPTLVFALAGGVAALLYVLVRPVEEVAPFFVGDRTVVFAPLLVVTSSLSAFVVSSCLWRRAIPERLPDSRWRHVVLGAFIGFLSMPVTMYLLTVGRYLFTGVPDGVVVGSPPPGATTWIPVERLLLQDVSIALMTSAFGFVMTGGLPILAGGATGEVVRRLTTDADRDSA